MEHITDSIARFVCTTSFERIPGEVIEQLKLHALDTIGTLCAGSRETIASIVKAYVRSLGGTAESTLITQGTKTSAIHAAFGNGILAHALDFDDYEWPSMAHPSVTVLPAVLALGEKIGVSGKACLEAYLIGLEVIAKVGQGINPRHYEKGWHSTSTLGVLGSAAASAKLLNSDSGKVKRAFGIAASMASGLRGNFGTMTKPFHAGHAAQCGVEAALLASYGFTADETIFERELGFCSIFTDGQYSPEKITSNFGQPFSIISPGIGMKQYPSCAATHSVLDAILQLATREEIRAEDVSAVECGIFYLYPSMLIHSQPRTGLEGKFSLEFCSALALLKRQVTLDKFTDDQVNQPDVQALIKKVKKRVAKEVGGPGTTYPGAVVAITLNNGTVHSIKVDSRRGAPSNPLSRDDIIRKFKANAALALGEAAIGETLENLLHLERLDRLTSLFSALEVC